MGLLHVIEGSSQLDIVQIKWEEEEAKRQNNNVLEPQMIKVASETSNDEEFTLRRELEAKVKAMEMGVQLGTKLGYASLLV